MALSALTDKSHEPTDDELKAVLGTALEAWDALIREVSTQVGPLSLLWGYTSKSTGWGLRLRHKERVIVYMTPQSGQFLVSFALGEKAVAAAHSAELPLEILQTIDAAPRYAEGRGVRLLASTTAHVPPLALLALIKHKN